MNETKKGQNINRNEKPAKSDFKSAIRCILIGIAIFFLCPLVAMEVQKSGGNAYAIIPFFMIPSAIFFIYGIFKLIKIIWNNIPE